MMTIVMGLDQHRAQITGGVDRHRHRRGAARAGGAGGPRRRCGGSLRGSRGRELEVALEATTGWRFVVEELRRVGAGVHLAEPAETSALRGPRSARRATGRTPGICGSC